MNYPSEQTGYFALPTNEVIRLRAELAAMTAQNESNNALLRAASESEHEIREALGPQDHSGTISDAVKALVAKCDALNARIERQDARIRANETARLQEP